MKVYQGHGFYGQTWDKLGSPVEKAWPRLLSYNFSHLGPFPSTIRLAESSVSLFTSTHPSILTNILPRQLGNFRTRPEFGFSSFWPKKALVVYSHCNVASQKRLLLMPLPNLWATGKEYLYISRQRTESSRLETTKYCVSPSPLFLECDLYC